jgi:hypothetical protein
MREMIVPKSFEAQRTNAKMLSGANDKRLGARIGITAVLHSWGSALTHHPHVHMIVPGGRISFDGVRWVTSRANFLVHVNVLARLFRGKMLAMLMAAHDANQQTFFNSLAGLADKRTFKRFIAPLRRTHRVPEQALRVGGDFTRFGESDRRAWTDREQLLLAPELVPETPQLAAGGGDVDV